MLNDCLTGGPCQFCGGPWVLSVQQGRRLCRTERTHRSAELTRPTVNHLTNDQQRSLTCTYMFAHVHTSSHMFRTCSYMFTHLHTCSHMFTRLQTCSHMCTCLHMFTHAPQERSSRSHAKTGLCYYCVLPCFWTCSEHKV